MKYLKLFETHTEYEAALSSLILPNVSFCKDTANEVHYNPYVESVDTRVIAKFNVTDISYPTDIANHTSGFSAIEIDGVVQPSVVSAYTFTTTGEHTVKYTLTDPTNIGIYAFWYCSSLTSIDIPNSVTSIGNSAFGLCTSLTSIDIPSGVTNIGDSVFFHCYSLTSINIPSGVTSIGQDAFQECSGLTNINIPSGVTSIGSGAFSGCTSLTSIDIPSGVTSIGEYAFDNCGSLTSVTVNAVTPPSIGNRIVDGTCGKGSGSGSGSGSTPPAIYVPSDSVDTYKADSGWSAYECAIQAIQ